MAFSSPASFGNDSLTHFAFFWNTYIALISFLVY